MIAFDAREEVASMLLANTNARRPSRNASNGMSSKVSRLDNVLKIASKQQNVACYFTLSKENTDDGLVIRL